MNLWPKKIGSEEFLSASIYLTTHIYVIFICQYLLNSKMPEILHDNVSVVVCFEEPVSILEVVSMHILEGLSSNQVPAIVIPIIRIGTIFLVIRLSHFFCFPPKTVIATTHLKLNTPQHRVRLVAHKQKLVTPCNKF